VSRVSHHRAPCSRGRVLIVEDEDTIGEVLVETLTDEGYEVRWARHGQEALGVLQGWLPQVILLDLMMPEMDGWAFRSAQRQLSGSVAEVPVIVLSAARETSYRTAELEAVEALGKPFELTLVVEAVGRWISLIPPTER
jgi:two-component system response regulator MprA